MADTATNPSTTTMADVLGKTLPALSATSDMPVVVQTAPILELAKTEEVVENKPSAEPEEIETEGDKPAVETKADNTDPAVKREITKARNKQREADARAAAAEQAANAAAEQLATALKSIEALTTKKVEQEVAEDVRPTPPARHRFESPDSYDTALNAYHSDLAAWGTRQGERTAAANAEKARAEAETKTAQDAQEAQFKSVVESFQAKREQAMAEYPDFVEVADSENVQITVPMGHTIMAAENGPQIQYHLGKNPAEAERISKLPPAQQIFELGRLSAALAAPPPPKAVTKAAAPIEPLGSRSNATAPDLNEMPMDDYARDWAARNARNRSNGAARPH